MEYVQDLIDGQSTTFRRALFILGVFYGVLLLLGVIWNFSCRVRRSTKMKKGIDNLLIPSVIIVSITLTNIQSSRDQRKKAYVDTSVLNLGIIRNK